MGAGWQQEQFDHYKIALNTSREGLSAWELIDLIGSGQFSKGMDRQTVSMAISEVFNELILDVLKQVGTTEKESFNTEQFIAYLAAVRLLLKILYRMDNEQGEIR